MNPEVKEEWLKRLRSGKIPQGRERLGGSNGERCCLGVLCDIAVRNEVIPPPVENNFGDLVYDGAEHYLPESVREWAGLSTEYRDHRQKVNYGGTIESLDALNDDYRLTFDEIADLIEDQL